MKSTQEVLEHHLQAFGEGLDSILSDYSEDSCIMTQQGTFRGLVEIRAFFTAFVEGLPEGLMDVFEVTKMDIDNEIGFLTWVAKPWVPLGTDTFVVRNGKILYQTFAAHMAE